MKTIRLRTKEISIRGMLKTPATIINFKML